MASFKRLSLILLTSCAGAALSACDGANDIASPGTGGNVIINPPATPAPSPTPTPTAVLVTPAAGCPTVPAGANAFVDAGVTQATPIGSWRICQLPAAINKSMTLTKYAKDVDKSKRSQPFADEPALIAFAQFENSGLRNGSHHASIWREGDVIKFRSGGTGAEKDIAYSRHLHICNGITIAIAALFLVELEMFSDIAP